MSALNRVELVGEAMRATLNSLAEAAPVWLRVQMPLEWFTRYGFGLEDDRLPKDKAQRHALAETIGADGIALLHAIYTPRAPTILRDLPAVERLRQSWVQNYLPTAEGGRWRLNDKSPPAASFLSSPYEPEAHYARKHTPQGVGYKVHLTETCDDVWPPLITPVDTTPAPVDARQVTAQLHAALQAKALLPSRPIVETGSLDAALLATNAPRCPLASPCGGWLRSQAGRDRLGPTARDLSGRSYQCALAPR
jgi:hypothetical protein